MDAPAPDSALDALRRDVLAGLVTLEERLRRDIVESATETRRYIDTGLAETRRYIDSGLAETRGYIDSGLAQTRRQIEESTAETRGYIDTGLADTRRQIEASTTETRRYFSVVAESLIAKMELLTEGIQANNERLDRFRDEVHDQFVRVDRRFLRLQASQVRKRRR